MDNRIIFAAIGFAAGALFLHKRSDKKVAAAVEDAKRNTEEELGKLFESMLAKAQNLGLSIAQVREQLNKS